MNVRRACPVKVTGQSPDAADQIFSRRSAAACGVCGSVATYSDYPPCRQHHRTITITCDHVVIVTHTPNGLQILLANDSSSTSSTRTRRQAQHVRITLHRARAHTHTYTHTERTTWPLGKNLHTLMSPT